MRVVSGDRHIALLAALGIAHVQAASACLDVDDFQSAGFANAKSGVIDQPKDGAESIALDRAEQASHFLARENGWQRLQSPDFKLLPKLPLAPGAEVLAVERPQRSQGQRDGTG